MKMIRSVVVVLLLGTESLLPNSIIAQEGMMASRGPVVVESKTEVLAIQTRLETPITVEFDNAKLSDALEKLARQVGFRVAFSNEVSQSKKVISLKVKETPAAAVLGMMLNGTGLRYRVIGVDEVVIERGAMVAAKQSAGAIMGRVVDSTTGKAVSGVTVAVAALKRSMVTDEKGVFAFRDVPVGEHMVSVKLFGYRATSRAVVVVEGKSVNVQIRLVAMATELSGVVTTATGTQRKIEVGNDITTINVDSVMKVMPVSSFTDLLATRVPGLTVMATSGAPGAPSKVRIRGVSSMYLSNDPVLIVDGIRVNSEQIKGKAEGETEGRWQLGSSPFDAIDPNSIETVEVFKGPSAVALYGTDAANGVIIVTTKRGQAGPARWSVDGVWGQTTMPGTWPTNYMRVGVDESGVIGECPSVRQALSSGGCTGVDGALLKYQLLNDPATTVFGTGRTQTYRITVNGGARGFSYNFSGSFGTELGLLKMAEADVRVLKNLGIAIPGWQRRPQGSESQSGTAKISTKIDNADLEFTTTLTRNTSRTTPLSNAINKAGSMAPGSVDLSGFGFPANPWSAVGSGVLREIPAFRERTSAQTLTTRNSLRVLAQPFPWIQTEATAGVDVSNQNDLNTLGRGDCSTTVFGGGVSCTYDALGRYNTRTGSGMVTTLRLRASAPKVAIARWVSLLPSVAGDYTRTHQASLNRESSDLPAGATSGNDGATQSMRQYDSDRSTAGLYGEAMLGFADRLFLPLSLRFDAGSGLGAKVRPTYPRISPSFLVSDLPAFRQIPLLGRLETVRLRTAYGQSGRQPAAGAKLRTYQQVGRIVDGVSVISTQINSIGNLSLRPERKSEIEGGADIETLSGRLSMSLTGYLGRTVDALVGVGVPPSVNGGGTQWRNVGTVRNTGMEMLLNATMLRQRSVDWQMNVGLSTNRNTLVKLGHDSDNIPDGRGGRVSTRYVEGYPLFGLWALPVTGFADLNGDGWITAGQVLLGVTAGVNEFQVGTDPVYLGAPYPVFESSLHSTLILFRDITIGMTFNYQHGLTQTNFISGGLAGLQVRNKAFNDPTTPLATQAYFAASQLIGSEGTDIGFVQTTSTLRFNALSIGYQLPQRLTAAVSRGRTIRIAVQGTNLGLWSNYSGKDPNVNSAMSEVVRDTGVLPLSRVWQFTMRIN